MSDSSSRRDGKCVLCGRVLPPRRWWQFLEPPPFCPPKDSKKCQNILEERLKGYRQ